MDSDESEGKDWSDLEREAAEDDDEDEDEGNNFYYFLSKVIFVKKYIQFKFLGRRGDHRPKTGDQRHRDRQRSKHKSSHSLKHRGSHGGSPSKSSSRQRYKLLSCPYIVLCIAIKMVLYAVNV